MNSQSRRNRIMEMLEVATKPMSGSFLAEKLGVSRQVIVTDIALLRTKQPNIIATSRGYIMIHADKCHCVYKVRHTDEEIEDELDSIVNLGGKILNVCVDHRIYGTIHKPLDISSKRDVNNFMYDIKSGASTPLKNITNGYHFHTIEAHSEKVLKEIEQTLKERGYLIEVLSRLNIYEPKIYSQI